MPILALSWSSLKHTPFERSIFTPESVVPPVAFRLRTLTCPLTARGPGTESNMAAQSLKVVCAWCNRVVTMAPQGASVTHTICPTCLDLTIAHRSGIAHDASSSMDHVRPPVGYFGDAFRH